MATTVPGGRHTPVSNVSSEATEIVEEQLADPETGSESGFADAAGEREFAPARSLLESVPADAPVPDTSSLSDIGAASFGAPEPSVMGFALESVVGGSDERVPVPDTRLYPFRAIANLLITARDGSEWVGTGWFISPRTLVTAGHCVCVKNSPVPGRNGWVRSIRVLAGRNGYFAPYGLVTSTHFLSVKGWVEEGDENFDYGALVIPVPLGERVGTFGFGAMADEALAGRTINVAGYPVDKPDGTLWHDSRPIESVSPTKVHYALDTEGGQSGAPAYIIRDGKRFSVAIHSYGGTVTNSGTRISQPVYRNLTNWRA